ncbi:MAG: hypothetical protein AAF823_06315 [Planctomycetota bacterium]
MVDPQWTTRSGQGEGGASGASGGSVAGGAASVEAIDEELEHAGETGVLERGLPWLVSLVAHAVLVLATVFIVWTTVIDTADEEIIIPSLTFNPDAAPPLAQSQVQRVERTRPTRRTVQRTQRLTEMTRNLGATDQLLQETMADTSDPFSESQDEAAQFRTTFFGSRGNARKIIFVVDAGGSVIDLFPMIKRELQRSINRLSEQQQFHVIFARGERVIELPPAQWKRADAQNKSAAIEWTEDMYAQDAGSNLEAIRVALRYRPQLVFLLSDNITGSGRYEVSQRDLLAGIEAANDSNAKINTLQFVYPDPLEEFGKKGTMRAIAETFGGVYRKIEEAELRLR